MRTLLALVYSQMEECFLSKLKRYISFHSLHLRSLRSTKELDSWMDLLRVNNREINHLMALLQQQILISNNHSLKKDNTYRSLISQQTLLGASAPIKVGLPSHHRLSLFQVTRRQENLIYSPAHFIYLRDKR